MPENNNNGTSTSNSSQNSVQNGFDWSSLYGMIGQKVGNLTQMFPTPNQDLNSNTQMMTNIRSGATSALLSSGNPYAMAAGAVMGVMDKTGGFGDASKGLGTTNDILNSVASLALPGAGYFTPKTEDYTISADMRAMQNGFASSMKNNSEAAQNAGAKILFGRKKAQEQIRKAKETDLKISSIKEEADNDYLQMASMTQAKAMGNQYDNMGGYQQTLARYGRLGLKLQKAKELAKFKPEIYIMKDGGEFNFKTTEDIFTPTTEEQNIKFFSELQFDEPIKFQKGGQMNVIPEGNLHARLHHMENADELTKKGIPVVDKEGNQQAEIELNEIIFNLEVTKKLEELEKKYRSEDSTQKEKDEAAIEAGKLLAKEIIENTDDRTGLIESVQ